MYKTLENNFAAPSSDTLPNQNVLENEVTRGTTLI